MVSFCSLIRKHKFNKRYLEQVKELLYNLVQIRRHDRYYHKLCGYPARYRNAFVSACYCTDIQIES